MTAHTRSARPGGPGGPPPSGIRPGSPLVRGLRWAGLAAVVLTVAPPSSLAFEVFGDSLDLTQRDYRILSNFTGAFANTNQVPDPDFPGSVGAELAIRKGIAEWGSRPHGSGLTDPFQDVIGSGGANFDAFFAGRATLPGGQNGNIVSVIAGGGPSFAFTELPIADGWRIRFFGLSREWSDRPEGPVLAGPNGMDIQGIMCHEYGHALGLDHTDVPGATMNTTSANLGVDLRSIEQDDIDGLHFIYGAAAPNKPVVANYAFTASGRLRIEGEHFDAVGNEVWFTRAAPTLPAEEPAVVVTGIASTAGGTVIEIDVPAEAGAGDVAVRVAGTGHESLSNAFPFDPARLPWTPPEVYGTPGLSSAGTAVTLDWESLPSATAGTMRLTVRGGDGSGSQVGILAVGTARAALPTPYGTLWIGGTLRRVGLVSLFQGQGLAELDLADVAPFIGSTVQVVCWLPDGGPTGGVFTNGLEVTVTD